VSAKLGFTAGLAVGLLAGSRAGRGLYDRSAAAASTVVHDPRVRQGASTAVHRIGSAGSTVAGAAARKITHRGDGRRDANGAADGSSGSGAEGERAGTGSSGDADEGSEVHRTHRFSMASVHGPDGFHGFTGFHGFNGFHGMSGSGASGWGRRGSANGNGHGLGTGDSGTTGTSGMSGTSRAVGGGEKGELGDKGQHSGVMSGFRSRHHAVSAPSVQAKPKEQGRPEGPAQSGSS
jgi:hypothetical protein